MTNESFLCDKVFFACSSLLVPTSSAKRIFILFFIKFFLSSTDNAVALSALFYAELTKIFLLYFYSSRELREIYTAEEDEIEYRAKKTKAKEDEERLSSSFVEWLNEDQLFESMWEGDEDGAALCQIGEDAEELVKEYKSDTYNITQEIYKIGLQRYEDRKQEIELFENSVKVGKKLIQEAGQELVNAFLIYRTEVYKKAAVIYKNIERASLVEGKDQFNSTEVKGWVETVSKKSLALLQLIN